MSYSLNEVEAMAKRAAKGAGYSWGMAEEASKATRWLCANGFDGCGRLAALLVENDDVDLATLWPNTGNRACPLICGAYFSDSAAQSAELRGVLVPAFLLPFVAAKAKRSSTAFGVHIDGHTIEINAAGCFCSGDIDELSALTSADVRLQSAQPSSQAISQKTRATPSATDWQRLNTFGLRTFAPATEESRRLGAG